MVANTGTVAELVGSNEQTILPEWLAFQKKSGSLQTGRITEGELLSQSRYFLHLLRDGLAKWRNRCSQCGIRPDQATAERYLALTSSLGVRARYRLIYFIDSRRIIRQRPEVASLHPKAYASETSRS